MHLHTSHKSNALLCLPLQLSFRNIQAFNNALMGTTPLFQIDTILAAPEIALLPKSSDVYKLIRQCVADCVESTRVCCRLHLSQDKSPLFIQYRMFQSSFTVINRKITINDANFKYITK